MRQGFDTFAEASEAAKDAEAEHPGHHKHVVLTVGERFWITRADHIPRGSEDRVCEP